MVQHVPTRRTVVRTAAWSVPAVTVISAAPAFAASNTVQPNLSTSVTAVAPERMAAPDTHKVRSAGTTFNNTGDVAAEGLLVTVKTSVPVTKVEVEAFGMILDITGVGVTISPALPATEFTMNIPAGSATVPANGSWTSTYPQRFSFASTATTTMETVVHAANTGNPGVPYISPQTTIPGF